MPVHDGGHRSGGVLGVFLAKPLVPGTPAGAGGGAWPVELPDPARHGGDPERQPHPPDARRQFARRLRPAVHQGVGEHCRRQWPVGVPAPGRPTADRARRHRALLFAQDRLPAVLDAPALGWRRGVFPLLSRRQCGRARSHPGPAAAGRVHHASGRGGKNRIANGPPPSAGWPAMGPVSPVSGRSILATISMPASRSCASSRRAVATSS